MTQCEMIVNYLMEGNEISDSQARNLFGCHRLASRIWDIVNDGYPIQREYRKVPTRFGNDANVKFYWIPKDKLEQYRKEHGRD